MAHMYIIIHNYILVYCCEVSDRIVQTPYYNTCTQRIIIEVGHWLLATISNTYTVTWVGLKLDGRCWGQQRGWGHERGPVGLVEWGGVTSLLYYNSKYSIIFKYDCM